MDRSNGIESGRDIEWRKREKTLKALPSLIKHSGALRGPQKPRLGIPYLNHLLRTRLGRRVPSAAASSMARRHLLTLRSFLASYSRDVPSCRTTLAGAASQKDLALDTSAEEASSCQGRKATLHMVLCSSVDPGVSSASHHSASTGLKCRCLTYSHLLQLRQVFTCATATLN